MDIATTLVELDQFDRKIIAVLSSDGRVSVTELARQVGLSKTPCQLRLRRRMEIGIITGCRAVVDKA